MNLLENRNKSRKSALVFVTLFAVAGLVMLRLTNAQTPVTVNGTATLCDSRADTSKPCTPTPYGNLEVFATPQDNTGAASTKVTSAANGNFSLKLAPGTYTFGVEQKESPSSIYCPYQTVEIKSDATQQIVFDCIAQNGQVL